MKHQIQSLIKSTHGVCIYRLSLLKSKQWSGRTGSQLQMNRLSLRNNRFETAGKVPILLEESIEEYTQFSKGKPKDVNM